MQQLPVSAHLQVVAHSGGTQGAATTTDVVEGGQGPDFAALLAGRIEAQGEGATPPVTAALTDPVQHGGAREAPPQDASTAPVLLPGVPLAALANMGPTQQQGEEERSYPLQFLRGEPVPMESPLGVRSALLAPPVRAGEVGDGPVPGKESQGKAAAISAVPAATIAVAEEDRLTFAADKPGPGADTAVKSPPPSAAVAAAPGTGMGATVRSEAAAVPSQPQVRVDIPLGERGWDQAFAQRVSWVVTNQHQVAQLQVNPPNLGPVEIRIAISHDQASASFVSPHAAVRDAIESALPRLREMLAETGLTLGQVHVSSQSFHQQQGHAQADGGSGRRTAPAMPMGRDLSADVPPVRRVGVGLVDTFA